MASIAIIGAGLSGLVMAGDLARHHDVAVFEKSRGVGGRMATRYAGDFEFDHGAQFFTARTAAFQRFLSPFIESGSVANWRPLFAELRDTSVTITRQWDDATPHYVGRPRMNSLARELAQGLDIRLKTPVTSLERDRFRWSLRGADDARLGLFDWVVLAIPAAQAETLAQQSSSLAKRAANATMLGCYALMLGFDSPQQLPWQAALVRGADISWISENSSKPGRAERYTLVAHSTNAWAQTNIEQDLEDVRAHLVAEISRVSGIDCHQAAHCDVQRWRFANIDKQQGPACWIDAHQQLAACGDWFVRGRIEAAFTSAKSLSRKIRAELT
jgi:predicted NAD/FAD-dependent oxidoreductase